MQGTARGIWENTNKAVVAEYFPVSERKAAFSMVYFSSGLAGAFGYLMFKFLSRSELAWLNIASSCLAIVCYHRCFQLFKNELDVKVAEAELNGLERNGSQ